MLIALFFVLCMAYYLRFMLLSAMAFSRKTCLATKNRLPSVSVVIPARNEAATLEECLTSVLKQTYAGEWEVILVDDHSVDETASIAETLASSYPQLRVCRMELQGETFAYKKAAITAGIGLAKGEIIVQTDADCMVNPGWLHQMATAFEEKTAFISGPIQLTHGKTLLEKIQSLESMGLVTLGAGSLLRGFPNMCNGANMAYRKSVFEEVEGFKGVDHVASGDDELLLQKIHALGKYNLDFMACREAIVKTPALDNWPDLKAQRLRWVSKIRAYYSKRVNYIQSVAYLAFLGIPILGLGAIWFPFLVWWMLGLIVAKVGGDIFVLSRAANFFQKKDLLRYILPMQPLYLAYVLWIGIAGSLVQAYPWKGRTVK
ncbi:MAG: glycosyltransferase [Bacteroidota bacterium]